MAIREATTALLQRFFLWESCQNNRCVRRVALGVAGRRKKETGNIMDERPVYRQTAKDGLSTTSKLGHLKAGFCEVQSQSLERDEAYGQSWLRPTNGGFSA